MSQPYATVQQIRGRLPEDSDVSDTYFAQLLAMVHSHMEEKLEFSFEGDARTRYVYSAGATELWLPPPGADDVASVVEDGVTLVDETDYELDPEHGRFLLRLDADGEPTAWATGRRVVQVTWTPRRVPEALVLAEIVETVRLKVAQSGGFGDAIGVEGSTSIVFKKAFSSITYDLIEDVRRNYLNQRYGL